MLHCKSFQIADNEKQLKPYSYLTANTNREADLQSSYFSCSKLNLTTLIQPPSV